VALFLCVTLCYGLSTSDKWREFKTKYNKQYKTHEIEEHRLSVFEENLARLSQLQSKDPLVRYGVTQFADLTPSEFKSSHLMRKPLSHKAHLSPVVEAPAALGGDLPATWDWRTKGVVGPIENEGQCGSTWAFSAVETFESTCAIAGWPLQDLSVQQVVDCDTYDEGCNGGFPSYACNYIIQYGLETESEYPYVGENQNCTYNNKSVVSCKMLSWLMVTTTFDETAMQNFIYANSPVSVCVDAETFQFYTGGVITTASECGTQIDHCLELVGWTVMDGVTAWIGRNQWGPQWGVSGYVFIEVGHNVCGIADLPMATCVMSPTGKKVC